VDWVKNTLELQDLLVSEALLPEVASVSSLVVDGEPSEIACDERGSFIREDGRVLLASEARATARR
jgi:hypothetical protein